MTAPAVGPASPPPDPVPPDPEVPDPARRPASPLLRDAFITIVTRFGLAFLIFATDIALARLLGPSAKGRFALVLLYSPARRPDRRLGDGPGARGRLRARPPDGPPGDGQRARVDRGRRRGLGAGLAAGCTASRRTGPPDGPLATLIPNLSGAQFTFAALAVPGEMFFSIGLFALLGRKRVLPYSLIRVARRGILLAMIVAIAAIARLSLDVALVINLVALAVTAILILWVAARDDAPRVPPVVAAPGRGAAVRDEVAARDRSPSGSSFAAMPSSSTSSSASARPASTRSPAGWPRRCGTSRTRWAP